MDNARANPLVTVIVPTRNSAGTLDVCLGSIKRQTYRGIELIVVDNNSTDDTKAVARKYTDKVFNMGPERNVQRSHAAQQASGAYLCFIDSDMELPPTMIESAVNKAEKEGIDAVVLPEISVGEGFWADCRALEKRIILADEYRELANRFIRREVYFSVGGYDVNKDWVGGEDYDINIRIKNSGYRTGRVEECIKHHEVVPFGRMLKKYYVYGIWVSKYFKNHPRTGSKQFVLVYPAYFRNLKLLVNDPLHTAGLAVMKAFQYTAGGVGVASISFRELFKSNARPRR